MKYDIKHLSAVHRGWAVYTLKEPPLMYYFTNADCLHLCFVFFTVAAMHFWTTMISILTNRKKRYGFMHEYIFSLKWVRDVPFPSIFLQHGVFRQLSDGNWTEHILFYIFLNYPQKIVKTFKLVIPNHRLISPIKNSGISLLIRVMSLLPLYSSTITA